MEPAELRLTKPLGGWPKAMMRLDLPDHLVRDDAFREIAGASRRFRCGVVATFRLLPLIAFPHDTLEDVARAYIRWMEWDRRTEVDGEIPRWTPRRKAWVCTGIVAGLMARDEAMRAFDLSEIELDTWLGQFSSGGIGALAVKRIQGERA